MYFQKIFRPVVYYIFFGAALNFAVAQQSPAPFSQERFAIHPKGGFMLSNNVSDFSVFEGLVNYCQPYSSEFTPNFSAGLFVETSIFPRMQLGLGVGYVRRNARFTSGQSYSERDTNKGQNTIVDVFYENEVLADLGFIEIQPEVRNILLDNFLSGPLRSVAAIRLALPMQNDFTQTDRIISPSNATFEDETTGNMVRERVVTSGDFPTMSSLGFGISAGLENLLKIGARSYFTQQIVVDYNFNNVLRDAAWKPWAIRAELGLRFGVLKAPAEDKPLEVIPPKRDTVIVQKEIPAAPVIQLRITDADATVQTGDELLASLPVVNAVFFERSSADIPARYNQSVTASTSLGENAYELHKNLLLQIAQIVFKNPKARIILEGATSGSDETGSAELARQRAESVRNALKTLGVPENSLSIRAAVLPRNPSNQDYPTGREENRRVDIIVQNAPLQEYVARQQFAQIKGTLTTDISLFNIPPSGTLETKTSCDAATAQSGSTPGIKTMPFHCRLSPNQQEFTIEATAFSAYAGKAASDSRAFDVQALPKEQIELKTDNFDAVLRFEYNSSALSPENKELLKQMSQLLPAGATITIYGSSDATSGSEQRNAELSAARANATEEFLKGISGSKFTFATSTGTQKFSEDTPEGRFLNRSIRVRVSK